MKTTEIQHHFHLITLQVHALSLCTAADADLGHLAEVVFVRFLHWILSFPCSPLWKEIIVHRLDLEMGSYVSSPVG